MKQLYLALIIILSILSSCSTSSPNFQSIYISDLEHNQTQYLANFKEIHTFFPAAIYSCFSGATEARKIKRAVACGRRWKFNRKSSK